MTLTKQKIEQLADYYLKHGFNHTTDEIVEGLGISHKTFFNRYETKDKSVELVMDNWFETIRKRFVSKAQDCNHAVEELLQFLYEIHYIDLNEHFFFKHILNHNLFISENAPFLGILRNILHHGISHYQFKEDFNVELYSVFMMNNITHYIYKHEDSGDIVNFLLSPILSTRGKTLLEEMDLASFL